MWNRPTVCAFFMSVINLARKLTPPRRTAPPEAAYVAPTPVLLMRTYWKYDASLRTLEAWEPDCWTQVTCPTPDDEEFLIEELHVPDYFLDDIRDKDERSRYEYDEGWSLIILRIPYHIDDLLLHPLILRIIQSVDLNCLRKNLLELLTNLRNRVRDNGKTAFLPYDVFIYQLTVTAALIYTQFLLFFIIGQPLFLRLRREGFLAKHLDNRRTGIASRHSLALFKSSSSRFQPAFHECFIQP